MKIYLKTVSKIQIGERALLNLELNDAKFYFSQLIQKINELLHIQVPYKYFKNKKQTKPWIIWKTNHGLCHITIDIATSIRKKK